MDKRLVVYEHWIYEEELDTWCHQLESDTISWNDIQVLIKIQDFMKDNLDLSKSFYHLVSVTKYPYFNV